jgi:hypothetical protein
MMDLFAYAMTLQTLTNINTNIDRIGKSSFEQVILVENPGVKYEKFCVDRVQYLKFQEGTETIIVPHFSTNNSVVICK